MTIPTQPAIKAFEARKRDHIELALDDANEANGGSMLQHIMLRHEAIPDLNWDDISLATTRLGRTVPKPFLISSMTAGHSGATRINETLAAAATAQQWAMGVGSQRRQLFDKEAANEWKDLRRFFPDVELYANIGVAQIIHAPSATLLELVKSIEAQALIIHCNPLQECIQPEGTPQFKGALEAIKRVAHDLPCPIILKETGCGFSRKTLTQLIGSGIAAVDISGLGGTHWGRIEGKRAQNASWQSFAAQAFSQWGIATVTSLYQAQPLELDYELWGSGGARSGVDAAKLIALGASTVGFAKPMLQYALQGVSALTQHMQCIENELRTAMFCTNSPTITALQEDKLCP